MITLAMKCTKCGTEGVATYVQRCSAGELRFTESFQCPSCDNTIEAYGGVLPGSLHRAFLDARGIWRVVLTDPGAHPLDLVRALMELFAMERRDALRLTKESRPELGRGTKVEAECWAGRIRSTGASVLIERAD
jgi:hypothetical protein